VLHELGKTIMTEVAQISGLPELQPLHRWHHGQDKGLGLNPLFGIWPKPQGTGRQGQHKVHNPFPASNARRQLRQTVGDSCLF